MSEVDINVFQKLDIRIGTVVSADVPEWSHWVMRMTVDFGTELGERTIFSGIMKFYKPEELIGKQFPFVINLKPKRIGPANEAGEYEYSQGMMLMATPPAVQDGGQAEGDDEETRPILFQLTESVPNGSQVH